MKKSGIKCFIGLFALVGYSQGEPPSSALQNIAPPSSPAFVLMDITPSNIATPDNIQAFSIQTISAFSGNSNGLANNNYAVEIQPYWYVKREDMNFFKYNNLTTTKTSGILTADDYTGYNIFGDLWKKASFSFAIMNNTFEVFEESHSYVSFGAKTRVITIRTIKEINELKSLYKKYSDFMGSSSVIAIMGNPLLTPDQLNEQIINLPKYKEIDEEFKNLVERKPLFALDLAMAYCHFLGDKSLDFNNGFGRFGVWASGNLALYAPRISKGSYVNIYGVFRYLRDGINMNDNGILFTESKIDYGGKLEFEFSNLSFAYEYITRDSDNNNESRSVGSIRYKINDALTLNGGFGKNFMTESNNITLFGLQWGFDKKSSVKLNPN